MNPITVWCPTCNGRGLVPITTLVGYRRKGYHPTRSRQTALVTCETCDGCCTITVTPFAGPGDVPPAVRSAQHPTAYPSHP